MLPTRKIRRRNAHLQKLGHAQLGVELSHGLRDENHCVAPSAERGIREPVAHRDDPSPIRIRQSSDLGLGKEHMRVLDEDHERTVQERFPVHDHPRTHAHLPQDLERGCAIGVRLPKRCTEMIRLLFGFAEEYGISATTRVSARSPAIPRIRKHRHVFLSQEPDGLVGFVQNDDPTFHHAPRVLKKLEQREIRSSLPFLGAEKEIGHTPRECNRPRLTGVKNPANLPNELDRRRFHSRTPDSAPVGCCSRTTLHSLRNRSRLSRNSGLETASSISRFCVSRSAMFTVSSGP